MRSPTEDQTHFDERVVDYIDRHRLNLNGVYDDLKRKREFLHTVMGYNGLMVGKSQFTPLEKCNDERVSVVVKGIYSAARKRLQKKK
jgi:hypothetical protein